MTNSLRLSSKRNLFLVIVVAFSLNLSAQTPPYYKENGTTTNTIPMNSTAMRCQLLYQPVDFNTLPPSGNITKIYFRNSTAGATGTFTNFSVGFIQNTNTVFANTTFLTGAVTALTSPSIVINGSAVAGGWYEIALTTPFAYDNTKSLIVEIIYTSRTGGLTGNVGTAGTGNNKRLSSTTATATTGTLSATAWNDFGIEVISTTPCIAPPNPGDASVSTSVTCAGSPLNFNLIGNSTGVGQTYRWESATNLNGPYTPVSGVLTAPLFTTPALAGTSYYRSAVTCGGNTAYSDTLNVVGHIPLPGGTYTINSGTSTGGTNFQTFADVVARLNCGITGAVIFNVVAGSGPYNEQVILSQVPGASTTNTITFNGNGNIISFATDNSNERAVIKLNGTDHTTLDNFSIQAGSGTYGYGVQLLNDADSNTVSNSTIGINAASTSTNYAGIVVSSSPTSATTTGNTLSDGNSFTNNTVTGGYYGITLVGGTTTATAINNNRVVGNRFYDFYTYGIYIDETAKTIIENNDLKRPTRSASPTTVYGIYLSGQSSETVISKNRIHSLFANDLISTDDLYGIYFSSTDATAGKENVVSNNLIYDISSNGLIYAIYNTASNYAVYYHNTVSLDDASSASTEATRGFYQTTTASGISFKNNLITITRGGPGSKHAIYMATTTTTYTSDNNNFYVIPGATNFVGRNGTADLAGLGDWQTATSKDANSLAIDPVYQNIPGENYTPTVAALDNKGTPAGITTDIINTARSAATPDIGAYEFKIDICLVPPVPGTIINIPGPACPNSTINLNIENNSLGLGQTYQWENATSLAGPWTAISGLLTSAPFDYTVGTATLYYRAAITCSGSTSYTPAVQVVVNPIFAGGTYTINSALPTSGSNFKSFNDAYNAMRCGISGPVVFNVQPGSGPYDEQLTMDSIQGVSAINTITFNGNGATISYRSLSDGQRAVIKLNGTDYVAFNNLKIVAKGAGTSEYGFGIHLINGADFNTINNCNIIIDSTTSSTNYAGIVISSTHSSATTTGTAQSDNNTISNNIITGGYYGITMVGSSTVANMNNKVINNVITEFYSYGVYVHGSFTALIEGNRISRPARTTVTTFNGIYFTGLSTKANVTRNVITNPFGGNPNSTSACNGIYFTGVDAIATLENVVSNNLVYGLNGSGDAFALYNSSSDNVWYYHNTISIDGDANSTDVDDKRGFYQTTAAGGIQFKNNIISITQTGNSAKTALYFNTAFTASTTIITNHNDFYFGTTDGTVNTGYYDGNFYGILTAWQTAMNQDLNSLSNNPVFENPAGGNYKPTNAVIDNKGTPVGITIDIENAARSATTPDIGAYEFAANLCVSPPTPGSAVVSASPVCENTLVQLSATGYSTGTGQIYQWQASTSIGGPYANISGQLDNPNFVITATATFYYRLAVTCTGNTQFSVPVLLNVNPGLPGGVYTIDATQPASTTNFTSFNAAKAAMSCGITGPVIFNVEPNTGPYPEQLILDSIPGTSEDNTVTFNGNGNTIRFSSSTSAERAVIKLNGADHIRFDSLIIDATGTGTYGYGVHLINNADSNSFTRNTVITSTTSTSSTNFGGIVVSASATSMTTGSAMSDANLFDRNKITGGYYGITIIGGTDDLIKNNRITNNVIEDFYSYGVYIDNTDNTLIEGNSIARPVRTSVTTFNGIYFTGLSTRAVVSKNILRKPFAGSTASTSAMQGIYFNGVDAPAGQANKVSNNLLYDFDGAGLIYALYNSGSDNVHYYHNTISLDNSASTSTSATRGFYQTGAAEGIEFRNNIISITRGGSGAKHAIYMATTGTAYISNNNDFFVAFGGNNFVGRNGTADLSTLANWQAATSQDANSQSVDPLFTNPASGNFIPAQGAIDDMGAPVGITSDILGMVRSATKPDIGAYEFAVTPCITPPVPGTANVSPASGICLGTIIRLGLTGNSSGAFQKYVWHIASSASGPWKKISDTLFTPDFNYDLSTLETFFRASVTCGSSTSFTVPAEIIINPTLPAGDYTIDPSVVTGGTNFQSFTAAVQALQCGIAGAVRFHIVPGTYNEQIRISRVPGASQVNTITFMSQNGTASSVNLTFNGTSAANYVIKLDSASHITFKNITITSINAQYGRVVEFAGTATNDSLLNNIIVAPAVSTTSTNIAVVFGTALRGTDITVRGNTLTNGSSGIYLSGTAGVAKRYTIENNTTGGSYQYGVYSSGINFIKIQNNTVSRSGILNTTSYGIYVTNCDSAYQVNNNRVNINGTGTTVYGIYLTGNQSAGTAKGRVANNKIVADNANTGSQYGLYVSSSTNNNTLNNVISVNTAGATSYGIYSTGTGGVNYLNNSVQNASVSNTNIAAYFSQTSSANGVSKVKNNIFSHTGGGIAMYIVNPLHLYSDYNMFYTSGDSLFQWGSANKYATIHKWRDTSYQDYNSIVYKPAFVNGTDLMPDLAKPEVWAMHGRGEQLQESDRDFNDNPRPTTLTAGVPDLGAYEFVPASIPVLLTPVPAAPVANTVQSFMLGTDTVAKIAWGATVPTSIQGRRYSGAIPPALTAGQKHMYFYTDFDITGSISGYRMEQFYLDPWHGFIDNELTIKLGRTNATNNWVVSANSTLNVVGNTITEGGLGFMDKFTGLTDGILATLPPIAVNPSDSANRGKNFWVGYGHHQDFGGGNAQEMVLYLGTAATAANVTVSINGTGWYKTYTIPANSIIASDFIPKYGAMDARLLNEGLSAKGISISSDVPITAYAHIYGNTNSGATMLMPVGAYGFEYYALTAKQYYASNTYSWFYVVAPYDSTVIEITPSKPTVGGRPAGVPFRVNLNKGEVYQVLGAIISGDDGYDMTGSIVKSVSNANGKCYPVAMFSGSSRTNIGCGTDRPTNAGDNIIQQNFPYRAWGRKYLTAPTSVSTDATIPHRNIYKVAVRDANTVVKLNGVQLTNLIDNLYYQYESNTADYIEADKPVMVAQFIPSQTGNAACGNSGNLDPEMIYVSPIEQGIRSVALYRNTEYNILAQYLTLIIPTAGVSSLLIDGVNSYDHSYPHPNLSGYTVIVKRWTPSNAQTFVNSDYPFTAITYGLGSAESYGYNAGTLIKNLNVFPSFVNVFNTATATNDYTCAKTPFKMSFLSTVQPQRIEWNFSQVSGLTPNSNVVQNNPAAESSTVINGVTYYKYSLTPQYSISNPGVYNVPIFITHPDVDGCNNRMEISLTISVLQSPKPDFNNSVSYCVGNTVQFNGTGTTVNASPIKSWAWDFDDNNTTAAIQNPTHPYNTAGTYDVRLSIISVDGCIGDTVKPIQVGAGPAVTVNPTSATACVGGTVTFAVQNPAQGVVYRWYNASSGGTPVHTGASFTTNVAAAASYYVESDLGGCFSSRTKVDVTILPGLTAPVVIVDSVGSNMVRFRWNNVAGATGYEVSVNGATGWSAPSSGATGTTHTVSNMQVGQTVTIIVRALGGCATAQSQQVSGTAVTEQVFIPNSFSPNGDGLNDVLQVYGNFIRSIRFMVFNQWGEKIVESTTPQRIWDGSYKGRQQPSGVYMYVCDIVLTDGRTIQRKGSINLIR